MHHRSIDLPIEKIEGILRPERGASWSREQADHRRGAYNLLIFTRRTDAQTHRRRQQNRTEQTDDRDDAQTAAAASTHNDHIIRQHSIPTQDKPVHSSTVNQELRDDESQWPIVTKSHPPDKGILPPATESAATTTTKSTIASREH
jgi:hypothetical protein